MTSRRQTDSHIEIYAEQQNHGNAISLSGLVFKLVERVEPLRLVFINFHKFFINDIQFPKPCVH